MTRPRPQQRPHGPKHAARARPSGPSSWDPRRGSSGAGLVGQEAPQQEQQTALFSPSIETPTASGGGRRSDRGARRDPAPRNRLASTAPLRRRPNAPPCAALPRAALRTRPPSPPRASPLRPAPPPRPAAPGREKNGRCAGQPRPRHRHRGRSLRMATAVTSPAFSAGARRRHRQRLTKNTLDGRGMSPWPMASRDRQT